MVNPETGTAQILLEPLAVDGVTRDGVSVPARVSVGALFTPRVKDGQRYAGIGPEQQAGLVRFVEGLPPMAAARPRRARGYTT
jgi:hypothetical protein